MKNKTNKPKQKFKAATGFTEKETQQIINDNFPCVRPNFTSGPWGVLSTNQPAMPGGKYYMIWNQGRGRRMLAKLPYTDCAKQDAHLIAAAPDMYEALEAVQDYCEVHGGLDELARLTKFKQAIKKARGES